MRDIAARTGVALGGAYYYFASKEAIVLAFYEEMQESSHEEILEALQRHKKLKDRLRCVLEKRFELLTPNRKFCDALFRHAPDSKDPLSPFSEETKKIRVRAIEHLRVAAEGGDIRIPADLNEKLPHLLWMYQLALILFWLYDRSPRQERTRQLMEKSLGFLVNLLRISSLPLMKPLRRNMLELLETVSG
jgi:AcrR family transcriptional regulator